ncbi:hypothetical protein ACSSNL_05250 [Thalassobius sp. S69A]|uniref:hypothetical protein n=1 Tax=unclassified Thalassovita TaxID=2619711 RepID=UPI000C114781|nr:hypothetical protein [Paracoccaceae bacterium]MBT24862.1 hypothetical protein [Paracoccaceae bacterium]|tara:strand:- start:40 stop:456 length:417 start_codon:yes stop_codon:yes gene_type:complete
MTIKSGILGVIFAIGTAGAVFAAPPEPVQQHNSNAIWFENWTGLKKAQMVVVFPNGKIETITAETGTPVFRLSGDTVLDGVYRYEISAATDEMVEIVNPIDNGRGENARNETNKSFYMSGRFVVSRNVIITPADVKEQ